MSGAAGRLPARSADADGRTIDELRLWRLIALEKQLPTPRFPNGVKVPGMVVLVLLTLVAALMMPILGGSSRPHAPQALIDSQRSMAGGLARSLNAAARTAIEDLERAAADHAAGRTDSPDELLESMRADATRWHGLALMRVADREPIAATGDNIGVSQLPLDTTRTVLVPTIRGDTARLLLATPAGEGMVLVGATTPRLRALRLDDAAMQSVSVGLSDGSAAEVQGEVLAESLVAQAVVGRAITAATDKSADAVAPLEGAIDGLPARHLLAVAVPAKKAGLVVALTVLTPLEQGASPWMGLPFAAGLLLAAVFAAAVVYATLSRPILRLLGQAKNAAAGTAGAPLQPRGPREIRLVAAALGPPPVTRAKRRWRGRRAGWGVALAALPMLAWSAAVGYVYAPLTAEVPQQVVADARSQVESTGALLGEGLDRGLQELRNAATNRRGLSTNGWTGRLERLLDSTQRLRSAYVVDVDGKVLTAAGRPVLRSQQPLPDAGGVLLDHDGHRLPVLFAHTGLSGGRSLVAEFDVAFLISLLERLDGRVRVVDSYLRVVLDTSGYVAFEELPGTVERGAAIEGLVGSVESRITPGHLPSMIASAPVSSPSTVAHLEWSIVWEQSVSAMNLGVNTQRRGALLAAALALIASVLFVGWQYLLVLRPLRRLARCAQRMAAGDLDVVITPQRHDELGAIAVCLDILRQAVADGRDRLGGAVRLRGSAGDVTMVMPIIPRQRSADPVEEQAPVGQVEEQRSADLVEGRR